eukprot:CAMPEP_0178672876 /NCGR_PEP_ID=MMETSP0698-20121128/33965_1 /TAXON_ID=265572 /ORGANISM="Extubocellulus spinifer, Strain CCMP396" /LENGTH=151 /DNA_ID=CAMNT_0020316775 /DNA_START=31 /DNA_END=483 /DNA_ORIENTATION=-
MSCSKLDSSLAASSLSLSSAAPESESLPEDASSIEFSLSIFSGASLDMAASPPVTPSSFSLWAMPITSSSSSSSEPVDLTNTEWDPPSSWPSVSATSVIDTASSASEGSPSSSLSSSSSDTNAMASDVTLLLSSSSGFSNTGLTASSDTTS